MAKLVVNSESLVSVADAIRSKGNTAEDLQFPQGFVDGINAIESGGQGGADELGQFLMYELRGLNFQQNTNITETPLLDCINITSLQNAFNGCSLRDQYGVITGGLKTVRIKNTQNVTSWASAFYNCRGVETIETLDFSKSTNNAGAFHENQHLTNLKIVPETIKYSIALPNSPLLSDESIQSIIDGLATVTTAQTLTLHADVKAKLTTEQLTTITNKNWSVA